MEMKWEFTSWGKWGFWGLWGPPPSPGLLLECCSPACSPLPISLPWLPSTF